MASEPALLVDFWGTWCGPCRALRPHLERLAEEHAAKWRMVAVNVDQEPEAAQRYDVMGTPTLLLFRGGELKRRLSGSPQLGVVACELESVDV